MNSTIDYLLAFSSFYRAAYAQETLADQRIPATLRKLPPGLLNSCGYGVMIRPRSEDGLKRALHILEEKQIPNRGVFSLRREGNQTFYDKVYL